MLAVLVAVLSVLCFGILIRRYQVREQRKERLSFKRLATAYAEEHKTLH